MCFSKRIRTRPYLNTSCWMGPRNLAIAFGDVKHEKFYIIVKHWICKIRKTYPNQYVLLKRINMKKYIKYRIFYLFFSALAASIILFAWSCGTSSYLTKSIWKEPLACVIALRSIAYLNISE